MNEEMARSLASVVQGQAEHTMPSSRTWGVKVIRPDGHLVALEDHAGWVYRDQAAFEDYLQGRCASGAIAAQEWGEWDDGEVWARGLSSVLGSGEYWNSGGGIWLVFYERPDGRFAVIGSDSGSIYASREEFEADEFGEKAESHIFV